MIHDLRKEKILLIEPATFEAKCKALDEFDLNAFLARQPVPQNGELPREKAEYKTNVWGDPIPAMEIIGNVAIIPIRGVLVCGYPSIYKLFGFVDAMDVRAWLQAAIANPAVEKIILWTDCPGGSVAGIREIALAIQNSPKRIGVFCDSGENASACYWATCGAYGIFGTPSSTWGCVGVFSAFVESKGLFSMNGLVARIFKSGKLKGIGEDGTEITAEQAEFLQSRVDELGAAFRAHVKKYRPVADDDLQGQWFDAEQAAARGFIDGIVTNMSEAIAALG